jgi:hemoglobin-like flavoprotein
MTPEDIRMVQATFRPVAAAGPAAAHLFYSHLFRRDPSLRAMFPADMDTQAKKLVAILAVAVNGLTRLDALVPALHDLGRRHSGYGVKGEHYTTVGASLLDTLQEALGAEFTPEVRAAWTKAYMLIAQTMQSAPGDIKQVA